MLFSLGHMTLLACKSEHPTLNHEAGGRGLSHRHRAFSPGGLSSACATVLWQLISGNMQNVASLLRTRNRCGELYSLHVHAYSVLCFSLLGTCLSWHARANTLPSITRRVGAPYRTCIGHLVLVVCRALQPQSCGNLFPATCITCTPSCGP